jgi:hypothetical protein
MIAEAVGKQDKTVSARAEATDRCRRSHSVSGSSDGSSDADLTEMSCVLEVMPSENDQRFSDCNHQFDVLARDRTDEGQ